MLSVNCRVTGSYDCDYVAKGKKKSLMLLCNSVDQLTVRMVLKCHLIKKSLSGGFSLESVWATLQKPFSFPLHSKRIAKNPLFEAISLLVLTGPPIIGVLIGWHSWHWIPCCHCIPRPNHRCLPWARSNWHGNSKEH